MALLLQAVAIVVLLLNGVAEATWCVARSDASTPALQTAMDYACGSGADCAPIQSSGLCFLPNTIQAHASYAFNSYYQRRGNAPGSCDFAGTATIAKTDPSYGSCDYPASPSTAGGTGGMLPTTTTTTSPSIFSPPPPGTTTPLIGGNGSGMTPSVGPLEPSAENSLTRLNLSITPILISLSILFLFLFTDVYQ